MTSELPIYVEMTFEERKQALLARLKSKASKYKYRRYLGSTLRYAGGKSLAVGHIVELLPDNLERLVSPFFGGGSVEIALSKELGLKVQGYDIFDLLTNYWGQQLSKPSELADKLAEFPPTKDEYKRIKDVLKSHWEGNTQMDSPLDLAAIYYFNHNTSYGPHFLGHPSGVYLDPKRYKKTIEKVRNFSAPTLDVSLGRFEDTIQNHKNDFIYADPPYFLGDDSKMFIGMYPHRNFPIHHNGFDHELLRDLLLSHKGGFILSYNDCPTIREWYKDFNMSTPEWQYTFSQGDTRIGENRLRDSAGSHVKKSHELLIWG